MKYSLWAKGLAIAIAAGFLLTAFSGTINIAAAPLQDEPATLYTIDVNDGTMADWSNVTTQFIDASAEPGTGQGTDLTRVGFSNDAPWMYIRWDVTDDGSWKNGILYDIGINRTGTGNTWDVYCAAQIEGGILTDISVRSADNSILWTAPTDGTLHYNPVAGGVPGTHSVEARFPLSVIGLGSGLFIGQFRSHASVSVTSAVKDFCPSSVQGYVKYNTTTGAAGIVTNPNDPMPAWFNVSASASPSAPSPGQSVNWQIGFDNLGASSSPTVWINITLPAGADYVSDNSAAIAAAFGGNVSLTIVGNTYYYTFTGVPPGDHGFEITCNIPGTVPPGTNLTCTGTMNYQGNVGLQESFSATISVGPVTGAPFVISLVGRSPGDWVLVSIPIQVSGNVQNIFNDSVYGDGQTVWDVAKWYDSQDALDPWKSYRSGGTANDMPIINNTYGIWLHLVSNGGDQQITAGVAGSYSVVSLNINLYAGWNLVGYPSATNRLASATLPAQADMVSVWQAATPYITDLVPGSVTMSHGNAYWVRVTADCTWTVQP